MMPFSKANARRDVVQAKRLSENENPVPDEAGPSQIAVELDLDERPQKRPRNLEPDGESSDEDYKDNGFPIFMKDFGWGLKESFGELEYLKLFPRPKVLMYRSREVWQDKEPNWKKIYGKKAAEERQKLPPRPRKMKTDTKQVQTKFRTRCSPKQLVELNSQLTQSQRKALNKCNPFHNLLLLKCATLHRDFIMKLADRFNPDNRTLEFKNGRVCPITEEDVARVSGLPIGDIPVPIVCEGMHRDKMNTYFKEFKGIKLSVLRDVVLKKKCDDKFQRAYMLFGLGCFLCPTQKDVVGSRLFPGVVTDEMEKIKRYKWAEFVLNWLVEEIRNYKIRASKGPSSSAQGVGGALFILMIIYFHHFPMNVEIGSEESDLPIGLWTKELIDDRISVEPEDKPTKESVYSQFPPHNMKNEAPIKAYHDEIHAFLKRLKNLRKWDDDLSTLRDVEVRIPDSCERLFCKEDGPSVHNQAPNEPDVFDGNYQSPRDKDVSPKEGQLHETAEMPFNDGGEKGDKEVTPIQGHVEAQSPGEKQVRRYCRRAKGDASTEPTGRRGFRETRQSKSTAAPYLAAPPFKVQKMTHEQKKIVDFLIRQPKQDGPTSADETCIKISGAKWPLTFNDVHRSFKPRGLVSKLVIHTVRDLIMMDELQQREEGKLHPKRHIFHPDFVINLGKVTDSKFNAYMRDSCDVNKVHYDVRKCSMLILPVLSGDGETGHWFCVAINLVDLRVEVLDSMQPADLTDRTSTVERIWNNLFALLNHGQGVARHTAEECKIVYPKVPQQDNGHDCGIYLIKFMELWKGRMVSAELESDNMNNIRRRVLYALFMDERNQQRDSVLAAINK